MWLLLYLDWIKRVDALLIWFHTLEPEQALTLKSCLSGWLAVLWAGMFQTLWISFRNTRQDVCWPWFSPEVIHLRDNDNTHFWSLPYSHTWVNHVTEFKVILTWHNNSVSNGLLTTEHHSFLPAHLMDTRPSSSHMSFAFSVSFPSYILTGSASLLLQKHLQACWLPVDFVYILSGHQAKVNHFLQLLL